MVIGEGKFVPTTDRRSGMTKSVMLCSALT